MSSTRMTFEDVAAASAARRAHARARAAAAATVAAPRAFKGPPPLSAYEAHQMGRAYGNGWVGKAGGLEPYERVFIPREVFGDFSAVYTENPALVQEDRASAEHLANLALWARGKPFFEAQVLCSFVPGRCVIRGRPDLLLFKDEVTGAVCPDLTEVVFRREYEDLEDDRPAGEEFGKIDVNGPDWAIWRRTLLPATDVFPTSLVKEWTAEAIKQIARHGKEAIVA